MPVFQLSLHSLLFITWIRSSAIQNMETSESPNRPHGGNGGVEDRQGGNKCTFSAKSKGLILFL